MMRHAYAFTLTHITIYSNYHCSKSSLGHLGQVAQERVSHHFTLHAVAEGDGLDAVDSHAVPCRGGGRWVYHISYMYAPDQCFFR